MNKLKLLLLLFIPFSVSALCNNTDLSRYKSMASNIRNYYDYNGSSFDITFYNVSNEFKIVNRNDSREYYADGNFGNVTINSASFGSTIKFSVYPLNESCSNYSVLTIYVNLPYFNKYYNDEVCINNSNSLCSKWANTSYYSYEQFLAEVKKTEPVKEEEKQPEEEGKKYGFFDFLADYYIYILLFIIVSGSLSIYYLDKKNKFDF